ncbi:MAG: methionyl-tRNA formyltransferase, partial [Acidimicrobiia bacterium]
MSRAVFLGTPQAATPSLRALSEVAEVVLVVTKPDRPRGRSGRPQPPPVKLEAERLGISISQPDRSSELTGLLEAATPVDLGVVVAFGMILRADTLAVPRLGFLNIHFSLLPRWRGAAPVQRAIMASDPKTGVTLLRLDEGLDTGPVLATQPTPIGELETAGELTDRLARLGAELLRETLPAYLEGRVVPSEQPEEGVTTALRIRQEEARLDLRAPAAAVLARVRALAPRPGAHGVLDGVRFK